MTTQEILQGVHDWTNGKIVYDISVAHPDGQGNPTKYATLAAALGTNGANIPQDIRKGGMSVKYVRSSDNKYIQYFLTKDEWSANEADWQKMNLDEEISQLDQEIYGEQPHIFSHAFDAGYIRISQFANAIPFELKAGRYSITSDYSTMSELSCYLYDANGNRVWEGTIQNLLGAIVFNSNIAKIGFYGTASSAGTLTITFTNSYPQKGLIERVEDLEENERDVDNTPTEDSQNLVTSGGVYNAINGVQSDLDVVEKDLKELIGMDDSSINLAPYISEAGTGILTFTDGTWTSFTSSYLHIMVPVIAGKQYKLKGSSEGTLKLRYALLQDDTVGSPGTVPNYCTGWSKPKQVDYDTDEIITIPSDCTYIYFQYTDNGKTADLSVTLIGEEGEIDSIEKDIDEIKVDIASIWEGKKIAWYGTSIPAGTSYEIPFKGKKITALLSATSSGTYPGGRIVETDGENCPHEYPIMVGTMLGANVYNQSVGSSKAGKSYVGSKTDLYLYCKSLANSVKDILDVICNCYTIDWTNHTISRNGSNDYGITSFFSDAVESSWDAFMGKVTECLSFSYEISLVSRYLISDNAEHASYVQRIFGTYYNSVNGNVDITNLCAFKDEIDVFVFDHGCNDSKWASSAVTPISEGILSDDPTTFEGAYNMFFNTIYQYRTNATIVILGTFYNWMADRPSSINRVDVQEAIARRWQFPFINMSHFIPATINISVLSNGYWEDASTGGVIMGKWHENGFTYNSSTGESNNDMFAEYGLTKEQIEQQYSPQQIDGRWYWSAPMLRLWCYNTPHPHSDIEGRMSKILTRLLSAHLDDIGNI